MRKIGAEVLLDALMREGVEILFGYPGGAVLPIFDKLYDSPIRFILTRHEQGAVHAADGFARATGKVGVCLVTSGPGATNIVTGIANANMDSIPLVAITGQVATAMIGNDAFQEADITGISRTITKHNYLVKDVSQLAKVIKEAFYIASTGRPGPVLVDLPKDVATAETNYHPSETVNLRGYKPTYASHPGQIKKACALIGTSKRPVIYAGGGVISSGASEELKKLAHKCQIPVTTTLMGLGGFPGTDPLFLGMLGMHGTKYANYAITESDLIIAIGSRFDDRVTGKLEKFAPRAKIIHIDIDPASISKNIKVDIPIVGDAREALLKILPQVQPPQIQDWLEQIDDWKRRWPLSYKRHKEEISPQYVVEEIYRQSQGKALIATEVGQNQMWAAQFYKFDQPRSFISSGGLGTMGFGFPAAIGAQIGRPDQLVIDIAGDGSFQMNIQELATAVQYKVPVKVAILNNHFLGMVRQWQEMFYNRRYSYCCLAHGPDFVKIAEAYGAMGIRVTEEKDVPKALQEAFSSPLPCVLDFHVAREENVFPMVPAGAGLDETIGGLA